MYGSCPTRTVTHALLPEEWLKHTFSRADRMLYHPSPLLTEVAYTVLSYLYEYVCTFSFMQVLFH